jgi:hypothetical protein
MSVDSFRPTQEPDMPSSTSVPVTVTPEAAARVAELGMQAALEQMIEHTRQVVAGLQRIEVVLDPPYDTGDEPYLTIWAVTSEPYRDEDTTEWDWGSWKVQTFPPDVYRHIALLIQYGDSHAGKTVSGSGS